MELMLMNWSNNRRTLGSDWISRLTLNNRGWTSSVLPLIAEASCPLSPLCHDDCFRSLNVTPLRRPGHILLDNFMVHVVVSGWTVLIGMPPSNITQLCSTAFTGAEAGVWFFLSRINARTMSLSSATSDETAWVEELVLILATTALFLD
ncbi:hypothetical protein Tco_0958950 [Tanacetum coccineum]